MSKDYHQGHAGYRAFFLLLCGWIRVAIRTAYLVIAFCLSGALGAAAATEPDGRIEQANGVVTYSRATYEGPAITNMPLLIHDRLRTATNSSAVVWVKRSQYVHMGELSELEILPPRGRLAPLLDLLQGTLYFFSRETAREFQILTPHGTGAPYGTEFSITVESNRTILKVFDGLAILTGTNAADFKVITNGQTGVVTNGMSPVLATVNLAQWWVYYPAVLDADELIFAPTRRTELAASLAAYKTGDLLGALAKYPDNPSAEPTTDSDTIYLAALVLAVGQVGKAEELLHKVPGAPSAKAALEWLIKAVQGQVQEQPPPVSRSASESLGISYYYQARRRLPEALRAASDSVNAAPGFGFGWERVAELQFSFGKIPEAREALQKSLKLASNNAQAHALDGFLRSAENRLGEARAAFEEAIRLDSRLGNAWLGRGLVRIRTGDADGGRRDLELAAVLEPDRSLLRSYLAKAYSDAGRYANAQAELTLAKRFDPNDPTPWFYSALIDRELNRINTAVTNLDESIRRNTNRAVYRSRFLLDEDLAVRSSSLAEVYRTAGVTNASLNEAARATSYDYANYSAHLFLSESFDALRDPTRFNLRYETPWFSELLLANLLSPVGGTPLSQHISQQEYVRLFQRDRLGLTTTTSYRSDGQFRELASQYGTFGNTGWSFDLDYQHNDGVRVNNELDRIEWYSTIKQQLTPQDSLLVLAKYQDYHSGDNFQYFDPTNARPHFTYDEYQTPIIVGGYHHEWSPGVHTLALGGRLETDQQFSDRALPKTVLLRDNAGNFAGVDSIDFDVNHHIELEIYTAEAQQILQTDWETLVAGARWQGGTFDTHSVLSNPSFTPESFPTPAAQAQAVDDLNWLSGYCYGTLNIGNALALTAGIAYEHLEFPKNFRAPPIQPGEASRNQVDPKAAVVWEFLPGATLRGMYARSLGGVSLDESFRLEPTQLAGFSQAFRTLIPESLVGSVSAPDHEIGGGALNFKFPTHTYVEIQGEALHSKVSQTVGVFDQFYLLDPIVSVPSSISQNLDYHETAIQVSINQLLGREWSVGAAYSFVHSKFESTYPSAAPLNSDLHADLQKVNLLLLYNDPSGFFAQAGWDLYVQTDSKAEVSPGRIEDVADQTFQQLNLFAGYRFRKQRGEIVVGIMNLTDQHYHFNTVLPHAELPTERAFYTSLRLRF